eukprot:TRINITY_DN4170_c0_g4_i1.p1 TRINITY_DN4170_c0_g4~~TRINITY_DN4170_c0_g4_i1.p1  ORF type:complete len:111 (+),score=12.84 TRINITY_DN4170_c0_g4_i1:79-411(+)
MPPKKQEEKPAVVFDASSLVTLRGADDCEFVIDRQCALVSKLLKVQLEELKEGEDQVLSFPTIQPHILEKAIQYFYYKIRYDNDPEERVEFKVPPSIALDLMIVASHLGC